MGRRAAKFLAASDVVSEIVIAGRNLDATKRAASDLGGKASAAEVDIDDEGRFASLAADSDIVVNAAGPDFKVALPAIRGAIKAGVHYCDVNGDGPTTERALALDAAAKASGVTALIGIGLAPGLSNLLMKHAASQLDEPEEVRYCMSWPLVALGDPAMVLAEWRRSGHTPALWQQVMRLVAGTVRVYRDGHWLDADPLEHAVRVALPQGGEVTAHPVGTPEPVTLPRFLRSVRSVSVLWSILPPQLNELWCELGRRIFGGELDESAAAVSFYENVVARPAQWLTEPRGVESEWVEWAEAIGVKSGRRVRYLCSPISPWGITAGPLATASLKILRGEIRTRGVLSPESCLDLMSFFADGARNGLYEPPSGKILAESLEVLE